MALLRIGIMGCYSIFALRLMAERGGFEPPIGLTLCWFSRPVHSTTLPPLRSRFRLVVAVDFTAYSYSMEVSRKLLRFEEQGLR